MCAGAKQVLSLKKKRNIIHLALPHMVEKKPSSPGRPQAAR